MPDPVVFSYRNSVLRANDIHILKSNGWLTDSIIGFYFEYLEHEVYAGLKKFLFVSPEVTQCIKSSSYSEVPIFLDPLSAKDYEIVFFPLNNNENVYSSGGSHWSLLVYSSVSNMFYHFDSSNGMNDVQAFTLSAILNRYFNNGSGYNNYKEGYSLQQSNTYDCGIYLICNVENIAKHWLMYHCLENVSSLQKADVQLKRANLLALISALLPKYS